MSGSADSRVFVQHPPGFRARRGLNWTFIGLLYTSFYTCRYNLAIANKSISDEFGFNKAQMGTIITTALLAYAFGQIMNGLLNRSLRRKTRHVDRCGRDSDHEHDLRVRFILGVTVALRRNPRH